MSGPSDTCYVCEKEIGYTAPRAFDMPGGLRHITCPRLEPSINAPGYVSDVEANVRSPLTGHEPGWHWCKPRTEYTDENTYGCGIAGSFIECGEDAVIAKDDDKITWDMMEDALDDMRARAHIQPPGTVDRGGYVRPPLQGDWDEDHRKPLQHVKVRQEEKSENTRASRKCPVCEGSGYIGPDSYPVLYHPTHYLMDSHLQTQKDNKDEARRLMDAYSLLDKIWMGVT